MEERVNIVYHPLPLSVRGFVTQTFDDNGEPFYTICLNTAFNAEVQYRTFRHEIAHIAHNDFEKDIPIGEIEAIRHATI